MDSLSNSRWQNRKERLNLFTNNRDIVERAIRYVVREGVSMWHPKLWASNKLEVLFNGDKEIKGKYDSSRNDFFHHSTVHGLY